MMELNLLPTQSKVIRGIKVRRVTKEIKVRKVRLDHEVKRVPLLFMKILLRLNLKD